MAAAEPCGICICLSKRELFTELLYKICQQLHLKAASEVCRCVGVCVGVCLGVHMCICVCATSYVVQCVLLYSCQQNLCSDERKRKKRLAK